MCVKCDKSSSDIGLQTKLWGLEFDLACLMRGPDARKRNAREIRTLEERVAQVKAELQERSVAVVPFDTAPGGNAPSDGN